MTARRNGELLDALHRDPSITLIRRRKGWVARRDGYPGQVSVHWSPSDRRADANLRSQLRRVLGWTPPGR